MVSDSFPSRSIFICHDFSQFSMSSFTCATVLLCTTFYRCYFKHSTPSFLSHMLRKQSFPYFFACLCNASIFHISACVYSDRWTICVFWPWKDKVSAVFNYPISMVRYVYFKHPISTLFAPGSALSHSP